MQIVITTPPDEHGRGKVFQVEADDVAAGRELAAKQGFEVETVEEG